MDEAEITKEFKRIIDLAIRKNIVINFENRDGSYSSVGVANLIDGEIILAP